eukprot:jgi/Botrbrau1/9113/Bobra.0305s0017.1
MSAQLVETSEDDSFLAVAKRVADLLNEGQERTALAVTPGSKLAAECESLLAEGKSLDLLDLLVKHIDQVLRKLDGKDLECCVDIISHLASRVPLELQPRAVKTLVEALTAQVDNKAESRLQGLVTLHNSLTKASLQYEVLLAALAYAKSANLASQLAPALPGRVESWIKVWKLGRSDERTLCLAAAELLRASKKRKAVKDAYTLTVRALQTFQGPDDADVPRVKAEAALALADFIRNPDLFQFDLLENPAVVQLASDPKYEPLHKLLNLVIEGQVEGLAAFVTANKKLLEENRLNVEDVTVKTRIMALLVLASKTTDISFAAVKSALGVEESAVESWIVRAIGKKLLEARIDQPAQRISIIKCTVRTFSQDQWAQLRTQLGTWKENVRNLLNTVGTAHKDLGLGAPPAARLQGPTKA